MDAYRSIMTGHSYFKNSNCLVVQGWNRAIILQPTNKELARPNVHHYFKFFSRMVGYDLVGNNIVPCHRIEAVLDVYHCFVLFVPLHFKLHSFKLYFLIHLINKAVAPHTISIISDIHKVSWNKCHSLYSCDYICNIMP